MQELQKKFEKNTLDLIKTLVDNARVFGIKIYFVGGLVRDLLLNLPIKDIDIVVEGNAVDFAKSIDGIEIKSVHQDFGTVKTMINNREVDFASTREEEYPFSGCLPTVKNIGCPLRLDVLRRDFTINAIALDLENFSIVDYLGGNKDLENKTLRIIHEKSFIDDPTRILRGLDFKLRFGFDYDENTKKQMEDYLNAPNREHLSFSRVDLTLRKLFKNKHPKDYNEAYEEILNKRLYKIFTDETPKIPAPELQEAMELFESTPNVYLMALKNERSPLCQNDDAVGIYSFFKNFNNDELALYWAWHKDLRILGYKNKYRYVKINTTGTDLLKLGFAEGRSIGCILQKLLEKNLARQMTAQEEREWVLANFKPGQC